MAINSTSALLQKGGSLTISSSPERLITWGIKTLQSDTFSHSINKIPSKFLFHTEDLIHPDKLKKMIEWKDFVFLRHTSNKSSIIKKDGLRCLSDLDSKLSKHRTSLGFANDPDLIYFRPVTPHGVYKINADDIVVAVPKNAARVFNQEERYVGSFEHYINYSMPVDEYDKLLSKLRAGEFLKGNKQIGSYASTIDFTQDNYLPEVCFSDKYISPGYFCNVG